MLVTNSLKQDLESRNQHICGCGQSLHASTHYTWLGHIALHSGHAGVFNVDASGNRGDLWMESITCWQFP